MESGSDLRAFLLSLGVHVALVLLLWLGFVLRLPVNDEPATSE